MHDPVQYAIERFFKDGFTYGTIIPTKWFFECFGLKEPETIIEFRHNSMLFAAHLGALRHRMLVEYKMALRSKPGIGQEVVLPWIQSEWAMNEARAGIFQAIRKARDRVIFTDKSRLNEDQRRESTDALNRLSFLDREVKKTFPS